jgi:WD40 repeat protein
VLRPHQASVPLEPVTTKAGRRCALAALPGARATIVIGDPWGMLRWLDLEQGRELRAVKAHLDEVLCLALSPDGRLGVSGGFDRTLRVWDAQSGAELEAIDLGGSADVPTAVAFTRDGRGLVVGFGSGTIARLSAR